MNSSKSLRPGQSVKVEHAATIVKQMDDNPFWWLVRYPDGSEELVSIARITPVYDTARATIDEDACITVASGRLSAAGAIDLYHWLRTHMHEFEGVVEVGQAEESVVEASE